MLVMSSCPSDFNVIVKWLRLEHGTKLWVICQLTTLVQKDIPTCLWKIPWYILMKPSFDPCSGSTLGDPSRSHLNGGVVIHKMNIGHFAIESQEMLLPTAVLGSLTCKDKINGQPLTVHDCMMGR